MKPITDEDLILHYYDETTDGEAIEHSLERSPELAARYRELRTMLDEVAEVEAPEPHLDYGVRLWRRLEPQIASRRAAPRWLGPIFDRGWAVAAAAALLLTIGVLAGRISIRPEPAAPALTASQRILMDTVAAHLARTELLLLELANAQASGDLDFAAERELARELSKANRLYRRSARNKGYRRTAALLDDLEFLFLEVAHGSDSITEGELADLQRRLDDGDLLFKVQVVGSSLRQTTQPARRAVDADRQDT